MPDLTPEYLAEIRALADAAYGLLPYREGTGWHWAGDVSAGYPRLALSAWVAGYGRCTVMDFDRWGMQSAGPRFPDAAMMMQDARNLATFEVGRRGVVGIDAAKADDSVYRYDVDGVAHPIPEFIAAANPTTVMALLDEIDRLRADVACMDAQLDADAKHATLVEGESCDVCTHLSLRDLAAEIDTVEAERDDLAAKVARVEAFCDELLKPNPPLFPEGQRRLAARIRAALAGEQ